MVLAAFDEKIEGRAKALVRSGVTLVKSHWWRQEEHPVTIAAVPRKTNLSKTSHNMVFVPN